jgi:hypothetical protein
MIIVDPTLRSFDTIITRIERRRVEGSNACSANSKKKGKGKGKKVIDADTDTEVFDEWEIEFEDTSM